MGSIYKLENMQYMYNNPDLKDRPSEVDAAIRSVSAMPLSDGKRINAAMSILYPASQAAREAEAAKRQAETQAEIDAAAAGKSGGRRSKKCPSARRRRSSKRKARKSRSTRRR